MRNAFGHVLSAAVLVSSFGASIPAFADENADMNKEQNEPVPALVLTGMEVEDLNAENLQPVFAADKSADADEVCEEVSPKNIDFASLNNSVSPLDNARSQIHSDVKRSSGEAAARSSADLSQLV